MKLPPRRELNFHSFSQIAILTNFGPQMVLLGPLGAPLKPPWDRLGPLGQHPPGLPGAPWAPLAPSPAPTLRLCVSPLPQCVSTLRQCVSTLRQNDPKRWPLGIYVQGLNSKRAPLFRASMPNLQDYHQFWDFQDLSPRSGGFRRNGQKLFQGS